MSARELGNALVAVGQAFESANRVVNGPTAEISVNVKATATGSFEVLFEVLQSAQQVSLEPDFITNAIRLKELLFGGGALTGVLAFIKFLRGRKYTPGDADNGQHKVTIEGDVNTYNVSANVVNIYQDPAARSAVGDIVRPVQEPGIDKMEIRENHQVIEEVTKENIDSFTPQDANEVSANEILADEVNRRWLSIVRLTFKKGNKWQLTDGSNTFGVVIKDIAFIDRVDNNEPFTKGDLLVCDLRTIQRRINGIIKTDYEVVRVVEHRPAGQTRFDL